MGDKVIFGMLTLMQVALIVGFFLGGQLLAAFLVLLWLVAQLTWNLGRWGRGRSAG